MKRIGNLIEKIADMDNLYLAFWKARKGKNGQDEIEAYRSHLEQNLQLLQQQILLGQVSVGNYHYFTIYDPKERQICAASFAERVLHHALMNVCHPVFEQKQYFHSYATRLGKGQYAALNQAIAYTHEYSYFLKLDVRKYFDSIDHAVLKAQLACMFKDQGLLHLFYQIIDSYQTQTDKGLPIGNLTSQYFANHYLSFADHYAKQQLNVPAYVRYMDDMVFWHHDKATLLSIARHFDAFMQQNLQLKLKPLCLNNVIKGVPFLGYVLSPFAVRLSQNSKRRFFRKCQLYENRLQNQIFTQQQYQRHIVPLCAFAQKAHTFTLRTNYFVHTPNY